MENTTKRRTLIFIDNTGVGRTLLSTAFDFIFFNPRAVPKVAIPFWKVCISSLEVDYGFRKN
jgi:hypothetical protein